MKENFMQLLKPNDILTDSSSDTNNEFFNTHEMSGTSLNYTIVLHSIMGSGANNDTVNIVVNGQPFDLPCGELLSLPIESVELTSFSDGSSGAAANPGLLVFGYAVEKNMF